MNKIISIVGFIVVIFAMSFGANVGKDVAKTVVSPQKQSGDTADHVMAYTDSQILSTAKQMVESVSSRAPIQLDSNTTLLGVFFVQGTRTIVYKYQVAEAGDADKTKAYLINLDCGNRILRAYINRGINFTHQYFTPAGEYSFTVDNQNCV